MSKRAVAIAVRSVGWLALLSIMTAGCAGHHPPKAVGGMPDRATIVALQRELSRLGTETDPLEARLVAEAAVTYSATLAQRYRVVPPARLHNVLIQVGLRDRGLCYHWTSDLMRHLQSLELKTFQLHWGVAHKGSDLREHNSVVISALDAAFDAGLVLDPWRNSGDLHWASVAGDSYPWVPLPRAEW